MPRPLAVVDYSAQPNHLARSQKSMVQPNRLKLFALGDCNTKGGGDGGTLVDHLISCLGADGIRCEAVNWGHTMTTTREGLARVHRNPIAADLVTLNYGLVDSWVTTIPGIYIPYFPDSGAKRVARKLLKFVKRRLRAPWIRRWVHRGEVVPIGEYDHNLRQMIGELRSRNSNVAIVLWSTAHVIGNEPRNRNIDRYNVRLKQIAETTGCVFIDSGAALNSLSLADRYVDGLHLSESGCRLLAAEITNALTSQLKAMQPMTEASGIFEPDRSSGSAAA